MKTFAQKVFVATVVIGAVALAAFVMQWILLVLAGVLLAILFRTAAEWLADHTNLSLRWATAVVLIAAGVLICGTAWEFGSRIGAEADQFMSKVAGELKYWQSRAQQYQIVSRMFSGSSMNLEQPTQIIVKDVIRFVAAVVLILFVGAYVSVDPDTYIDGFLHFFPNPRRRRVRETLGDTGTALKWWLFGQLIAMAAVGTISAIGLLIIGVPMAVPLAVLAGILTFVPYVGALVSAVPALLIGFSVSPHTALWVLLVYLIAHMVEGYVLGPIVQHRFVSLPPALILANQFLMELLGGIVGIALATPLLVVEMVLIDRFYFKERWSEDEDRAA